MFCYQCQETLNNQGCEKAGVCGKSSEVSDFQDLLIYVSKGISFWAVKAREFEIVDDEADTFVTKALFTTVTNVNFDPAAIERMVLKGREVRDNLRERFLDAYREKTGREYNGGIPGAAEWNGNAGSPNEAGAGVLATKDEDIRSLRELVLYGVKGIAAYAEHAMLLGYRKPEIFAFMHEALAATLDTGKTMDQLLELVVNTGKCAVGVMALLDAANTGSYGNPEPTEVFTGTFPGPAILVSGHDLKDLEELLKQTEGTGVNVYTHGEMLPAHAYPAFKKFGHLAGNYGTSWYNQQKEFPAFNGAILFTTNCLQKPLPSYQDRVFTTGVAGWPGLPHIADRLPGGAKDFSSLNAKAKELGGLDAVEGKRLPIGFAHETLAAAAPQIIEAVKKGAIKRFFVMAGCDGRQAGREYFTELAEKLPEDTVILTAGCAKYRYNHLDLGTIGGIPRVIDAGQCNDSYSLAVTALKLAEAFGVESVNDLPISFDIAWYEQKAVTVLLALLYLGVKGIRLGPTLPAFLSPNVLKRVSDIFDLKPISIVDMDLQAMFSGK